MKRKEGGGKERRGEERNMFGWMDGFVGSGRR